MDEESEGNIQDKQARNASYVPGLPSKGKPNVLSV